MKTVRIYVMMSLICLLAGCNDDDRYYDEMPREISGFLAQYYPDSEVSDFGETAGVYTLQIKNGATLRFDNLMQWIYVNGNGATLPGNFLYNELPEKAYDYLEETENVDGVYMVARDKTEYTITLKENTLHYNSGTGKLTGDTL